MRHCVFKWTGNTEVGPRSPACTGHCPEVKPLCRGVFSLCTQAYGGKKLLLCSLPLHLLRGISFTAKMSNWLIYGVRGILIFFSSSLSFALKKPAEFSSPKAGGTSSVSLIDL